MGSYMYLYNIAETLNMLMQLIKFKQKVLILST